jgi:CspA family cold shock protein
MEARGFGFIEDEAGGPDIFFHANAMRGSGIDSDDLKRGDHLAFEIGEGRDGRPAAANVRRAE